MKTGILLFVATPPPALSDPCVIYDPLGIGKGGGDGLRADLSKMMTVSADCKLSPAPLRDRKVGTRGEEGFWGCRGGDYLAEKKHLRMTVW